MTVKGTSILDEFFDDILCDYKSGMSASVIARKYKTTITTTTSFLKRHAGFQHFGRGQCNKVSKHDIKKIADLYRSGARIKEISKQTGRSKSTVFSAINSLGISHRGLVDYSPSAEAQLKHAITKERNGKLNDAEQYVFDQLKLAGFECVPQARFGIYNMDIAIPCASIAVEVTCRGTFGAYSRAGHFAKRIKKLSEFGWHTYFAISADASTLRVDGINDLIEWVKFCQRSPAIARQYRMVRSSGNLLATGCSDCNQISSVLSLENIAYISE
jgi:hypothetical protein